MKRITLPVSTPKKILSNELLKKAAQKVLGTPDPPLSCVKGTAGGSVGASARRTGPILEDSETDAGTNGVSSKLNAMQQSDAELVAKLPSDFPIQKWDSMSTKAQLQAMKFSGLTESEQWALLNPSAPLSVLAQAAAQQKTHIVARAEAKVLPAPELSSETPKTTPLQSTVPGGESKGATPLPVATPKPGPTPQITPNGAIQSSDSGAVVPRTISELSTALAAIDSDALSSSGKHLLTLAQKKLSSSSLSSKEREVVANTFLQLKAEEYKSHFLSSVAASSQPSATWDSTMINNQEDYSGLPGSFGIFGSIKNNGCGFIAIHNLNQILGDRSRFSDEYYELYGQSFETTLAGGLLGMNPKTVRAYYESKGYHVALYSIQETSEKHDGYIMLYAYTKPGAHYIAIEYDTQIGKYIPYNDTSTEPVDNLDDLLSDNAFFACVWAIDK